MMEKVDFRIYSTDNRLSVVQETIVLGKANSLAVNLALILCTIVLHKRQKRFQNRTIFENN